MSLIDNQYKLDEPLEEILSIKNMYIPVNRYSRPSTKLKSVKGLVVHWVAVAGGTLEGMGNFFAERRHGQTGYGSAQLGVGIDGTRASYMPLDEMAYHVGAKTYTPEALKLSSYPNNCTIGVELCNVDMEGTFSEKTLESAGWLFAWLCYTHELDPQKDIYRHYDIVGHRKNCPKLFVDNPSKFQEFKDQISSKVKSIDRSQLQKKKNREQFEKLGR